MRKLPVTLTAALAFAAAALPAAAGADPAAVAAPSPADTALRPTAVEYAVMLAATPTGPETHPASERGRLDTDPAPAIDPGFGRGANDPAIMLAAPGISRDGVGDLGSETGAILTATGYYSPAGNTTTWPPARGQPDPRVRARRRGRSSAALR